MTTGSGNPRALTLLFPSPTTMLSSSSFQEDAMKSTSDVWEQTKKILESHVDRATFLINFRGTYLADDRGEHVVVDVPSASTVSTLARKHEAAILAALTEVGRPNTTVQLRADLTFGWDGPDWYVRELIPSAESSTVKMRAERRRVRRRAGTVS